MKDIRQEALKPTLRDVPQQKDGAKRRRAYLRPELTTHDSESILRAIGPAHGIYGFVPGSASGGSL